MQGLPNQNTLLAANDSWTGRDVLTGPRWSGSRRTSVDSLLFPAPPCLASLAYPTYPTRQEDEPRCLLASPA
jgi:hypothetical protein